MEAKRVVSKREIRDIARLDERIKVITQSNLGVSAARNEGIKHSKGKYLTFVDADDVLVPYFFQKRYIYVKKKM
ncbi:MAG: glycosyltransferase family A protein [Blautia wexlerae]